MNGNGQWDDVPVDNPDPTKAEPFCDANGNGRWDGIYTSGANDSPVTSVHDDIDARAFAIGSGGKPLVYVSVVQQGLFENYTDAMRTQLKDKYGVDADMVVSADHNESSPDTLGIYGAETAPEVAVSLRSGIDEYFMRYLEDRVAHAAADAVKSMKPAKLYANQAHLPEDRIRQRWSEQFPTFVALPNDNRRAAVDLKLGVLQARDSNGKPIFTVLNYAAHNQEMGRVGPELSSDWPGAFARSFESKNPGTAIFLVGDNGSQEDPTGLTESGDEVIKNGSENHGPDQYVQTKYTGEVFADLTEQAAKSAVALTPGAVSLHRSDYCVPLENNGFAALVSLGVFGQRQAYVCDANEQPVSSSPNGHELRTYSSYADIGPDLQLMAAPGEAFPALMFGSPFGVEDESCNRPNPAVPGWHAKSAFRFPVGLADDMLGYLIPAWGFYANPPELFQDTSACGATSDPTDSHDPKGHDHKLESESVGPTGSNAVADRLAGLLDAEKDPIAHISNGRYVLADGSLSHWPTNAVGVLEADAGATTIGPTGGRFIGFPGVQGAGGRAVDATGVAMDFDGQPEAGPDVLTRGAITFDAKGCAGGRYYAAVFDALTETKLGAVQQVGGVDAPAQNCKHDDGTQDDANGGKGVTAGPGADNGAGSGGGSGPRGSVRGGCTDRIAPHAVASGSHKRRGRTLRLRGRASDKGCGAKGRGRVVRVTITVLRHTSKRRCVFVAPSGHLGSARACRSPIQLLAKGAAHWRFSKKLHVKRGTYTVLVRAFDAAGNGQRTKRRRGATILTLRVR